jgi:mannose/fructose/N-acetylgalactosamine-specific phosphotransferase system component IIB
MSKCKIVRIDDRLIHGQVVVGWASKFQPEYLVLIDDDIANDDLDKDLYLIGVPEPYKGLALNVEDGVKFLASCESYIVVIKSPAVALDLVQHDLKIEEINIGGMHADYGKQEFNRYVYVDNADISALNQLKESGIKLNIRDLPGEKEYRVDDLLNIKLKS